MFKNIILETDNFIVINKPKNLAVHGGYKIYENLISKLKTNILKNKYIKLAHRIDKDTSGCIIIAKNKKFLIAFQRLLKNNKIIKEYHAIIKGNVPRFFKIKLDQLILNKYNKKIKKINKDTIANYYKIKQYKNYSLIKIILKTGKMHQIRIHLAHIGYPIVMDKKYGNKLINITNKIKGITKILLHSRSIKFKCPISNKFFNITAKYDFNFKNAIEILINEK